MIAEVLTFGDDALLVQVGGIDEVLALDAAVRTRVSEGSEPWASVVEVVPGARTVMISAPGSDLSALTEHLAALAGSLDPMGSSGAAGDDDSTVIDIPVVYDGEDLEDVQGLTGLTREELISAHSGRDWLVGFGGFAPGFAYLVHGDPRLVVPRRAEPRIRVPAGAVGIAGAFSGIYPRSSPGGWQLIGRTDAVLWDAYRDEPALLVPGSRVRFRSVDQLPSETDPPAQPAATTEQALRPRALGVLRVGPLAAVVDLGRPGVAHLGVTGGGAADRGAHSLAARLLAQDPSLAALEITLGGFEARAVGDLTICVTGAPAAVTVDGREVAHSAPVHVRSGQSISIDVPPTGLRSYLAVRGGIDVPATLGSRSTDTLSGLGPSPVQVGDHLPVGDPPREQPTVDAAHLPPEPGAVDIMVRRGPRDDWFAEPNDLVATGWTVSSHTDRVGVRLEGGALRRAEARAEEELPSEAMVAGAIQIPPNGQPVIFLRDHPVTGGYPVIGVISAPDLDRVAQLRPGDRLSLRWRP